MVAAYLILVSAISSAHNTFLSVALMAIALGARESALRMAALGRSPGSARTVLVLLMSLLALLRTPHVVHLASLAKMDHVLWEPVQARVAA